MAGNALVKISRETKRLRKKHPGMSFKSAQKKAASNYRSGKMGAPKKSHPKKHKRKHKARKRSHKRKRSTRTVVVVSGTHAFAKAKVGTRRRRKRSRPRYKVTHKVRRVSGSGGGMKTKDLLLVGALAVGGVLLYKAINKPSQTTPVQGAPPLNLTGNTSRDSQASQIIAWATAGGMALNAIANLITSLNNKSDAQVSAIHSSIAGGDGVPDWALI